jgi:SH3-like domain-containing protein
MMDQRMEHEHMKTNHYLWIAALVIMFAGFAEAAERVAVKGSVANIRALPNTGSDTLWQVEKYHPLLVIEKKGKWFRVKDFEGDRGWIFSTLVDQTATIIVKVSRANIRTGPGTQHDLAFDAGKGTPFKVLEKNKRWLKVQHSDGDVGWIFTSLVW